MNSKIELFYKAFESNDENMKIRAGQFDALMECVSEETQRGLKIALANIQTSKQTELTAKALVISALRWKFMDERERQLIASQAWTMHEMISPRSAP